MTGKHPIHIHPVGNTMDYWGDDTLIADDQVRPLYRYSATLLGASMWFFVRADTAQY